MKTIIIPSRINPFRVLVNGIEYVYEAGTVQTVPDDVADIVQSMIAAEPKEAPLPGKGGQVWTRKPVEEATAQSYAEFKDVLRKYLHSIYLYGVGYAACCTYIADSNALTAETFLADLAAKGFDANHPLSASGVVSGDTPATVYGIANGGSSLKLFTTAGTEEVAITTFSSIAMEL